jgi:hypothetical protein
MRDFCASIARVVDFFGSRHPEIVLEGGRVFGSGIGIANIDSVLGEALGLDMEIVEHLVGVNIRNMKAIPGVNQLLFVTLTNAELAHYLPNIGALMNSLNLTIAEDVGGGAAVVAKKGGIGFGFLFAALVLVIVGSAGTAGSFMMQRNNLRQEVADLDRSIAALRPAEAVQAEHQAAQVYYETFMAYVNGTKNNNEAFLQTLITLEEILPYGMVISGLSSSQGGVNFTVNGGGKESVAKLIIELKKIPFISEVWIATVGDSYDEFDIVSTDAPVAFRIDYEEARKYAADHGSLAWDKDADFVGYVPLEETGEEVTE